VNENVALHVALDDGQRRRLQDVTGLEPMGALGYFDRFYAAPLAARLDLSKARILDCACGYGWLSAVLALRGARQVVAADLDEAALTKARVLVDVLGVADRVEIVTASRSCPPTSRSCRGRTVISMPFVLSKPSSTCPSPRPCASWRASPGGSF
jgi:predicted RNA methylase